MGNLKQSRELVGRHHISVPCHKTLTSLLQAVNRFEMLGGVPRDIFMDFQDREVTLGTALSKMDLSLLTDAANAADTFSAASHQLVLISVPAWRTGQRMPCEQQANASHRQAAPLPHAGDFRTVEVASRSLYVTGKIWDKATGVYRQALCMKLIAGVAVSQWLVRKACDLPKRCVLLPDAIAG